MASPFNIKAGMQRAGRADVAKVADPGDGLTISPDNYDRAYVVVEGGTTRVLAAASRFPVNTEFTIISQTSSITVSTVDPANVALADGEYVKVVVTLDSSGDKQWAEVSSSNTVDNGQILPASAGTYEFTLVASAADNQAGIVAILAALESAGLIDDSGITIATS